MKKVIIIFALFSCYQFAFSQNREAAAAVENENNWMPADNSGILSKHDDAVPPNNSPDAAMAGLAVKERNDTIPIKRPDTLIIAGSDSVRLLRHNTLRPTADTLPPRQRDSSLPATPVIPADSSSAISGIPADSSSRVALIPLATDTLPLAAEPEKPQGKTPRGATIRSAIIPGWGQAYNNRYWKIPIVYGALGGTGAVFAYNIKYYKKIRFAYTTLINKDTANFINVAPELMPFIEANDLASLRLNRNTFRKNIDYSVLFFLFFWGLNVLDATVDAHLKGFNVSDDLSLKVKPLLNTSSAGFSLVLDIHKGRKKMLFTNIDL